MVNPWEMFVLAVVQGVAEFLPISSSGHLVLLQSWFGATQDTLTVNIALHAGTLLSILVVYFRQWWKMLTSDRRVIGLLIIGSIPAACIGIPLEKYAGDVLENAWLAASMLLVTGAGLLYMPKLLKEKVDYIDLSWGEAFLIGCFQAFAILPGISRSGSTIFAGLLTGLKRQSAIIFSFLLAIPVLGGATLLKGVDLVRDPQIDRLGLLLAGAVVSFAVGCGSLLLLMKWSQSGRLHLFGYYCLAAGSAALIWLAVTGAPWFAAPASS